MKYYARTTAEKDKKNFVEARPEKKKPRSLNDLLAESLSGSKRKK